MPENLPYFILAFGLVTIPIVFWLVHIKIPRIIRGKILTVPNFNIEKIYFGKEIGVAFDFSNRTFVYSDIMHTYLFHAS